MSDFNDEIRAQARRNMVVPHAGETMGGALRRTAGVTPPLPPPDEFATAADYQRARAAVAAGMAAGAGRWVKGETPDEMAADAQELAQRFEAASDTSATPDEPGAVRPAYGGMMDGGVRGSTAPEPPSMDALLRAGVEEKQAARYRRAGQIDRELG